MDISYIYAMARTETIQIPLGFKAPDFSLPDVISGATITLSELAEKKATVIVFMCNHCPFVKHIIHELVSLAKEYIRREIQFIAINSNDVESYPEDSPEKMNLWATKLDFPFPYLFDETQEVAKAYGASCTPDFSIFDKERLCIYRGRMDASTPGNGLASDGKDIKEVLDSIISNSPLPAKQFPSIGCNIKWKKII